MFFPLSERTKGIFSIISAIIINIVCGSLNSWSGINGYYISYLKYSDSPSVEIKDGYFFIPLIMFTSLCCSPLVSIINEKIGIKYISLMSMFLIFITNIALYYSTNIFYVYGCMISFGIISGMNYMPVIKNCLFFFPHKKGFINGLVLFGYGTSSIIYVSIADYLINPTYKQINPSTGFYDKEIADNIPKYLIFFNIFNGIMAIISFLILFEYKKSDNNKKDKLIEDNNFKEKLNNKIEREENTNEKEQNQELSVKEAFIQSIKGIQIYQLWTMNTIIQIVSFTISNTYRSFGEQSLMEEHFLTIITKIYSILNGISRLMWGYLFDKFTFKCLFSICIIVQIIIGSLLYFSTHYPILFLLLICFESFVSGKISLNVTMYTKLYGIKYFGFIYSVSTAIGGFTHLLGPSIIKIVVKNVEDYKKLFIGGSIACFVSLIILIRFSEKPFKYKIKEENEKELKEV
jgi:MFS family permease